MQKRVSLEDAISFTKLSVTLACSWPPSPRATKIRLSLFDAAWCVAFVSCIALLLPLLIAIYEYRNVPIVLGKTVCLAAAVAQVTIKMLLCRLQRKQLQILCFDLENFCKNAAAEERTILQRYANRYKYYHGIYVLWSFLTAVCVPLKSFVFVHQSLVGFQVSSGMAVDTQVAFILRYAAARFELLGIQLRKARSVREFNACIDEHSQLLRYTQRIRCTIRFLIFATIATTTVAIIFGSLNLVANQSLALKAIYAIVVFSASVELFMYAWPADNLMRMSSQVATDAYNTDWFERSVQIRKIIFCIILRAQKLEAIRIDGIVPKLSLSYYAKYLYASLSYFTALRIIIDNSAPAETL